MHNAEGMLTVNDILNEATWSSSELPAYGLKGTHNFKRRKGCPAFDLSFDVHVTRVGQKLGAKYPLAVPIQQEISIKH